MAGTVLVTGGSGYIAGYLIRQLVAEGWTVNTTVRSLSREAEVRKWLAVDASPFPAGSPTNDDELIVPAREGALRALRFAKAAGVQRFVLTSSVAAVAYGHGVDVRPYTEADWSDLSQPGVNAYVKSKTIAERAARDWMAAEGAGMEFCSVNPSAVLGPLLSNDFSTSIQFVQRLIDGSMPGTPRLGFAVVDVRDLADLHVRALQTPGLDGERFIAAGAFLWMTDVAVILHGALGDKAKKVPRRSVPDFVIRLMALFDGSIKQVLGELGRSRAVDASHAEAVLGWKTRDEAQSIVDTANSLIEFGVVKV
jgi:dihydroflavonol-4-reductase